MRELQIVNAAELASTYAVADYAVALDGDTFALRVGQPAPDLEAYWPAARYLFITAWNPAAAPRSDTANEAADSLLVAQLDATGAMRQAAWAEDPNGDWREPGWLVADLDPAIHGLLAREFGQAAVLAWQRGQPVRLQMMMPCPRNAATSASTDWADE